MAKPYVAFEAKLAKIDVKQHIDEYGEQVRFLLRDETNVQRDKLGSIKNRSQSTREILMNAYPVDSSPTTKKLEKVGIREPCDMTIHTAVLDWDQLVPPVLFEKIDITRLTVFVGGDEYEVKSKHDDSVVYGYYPLYYVFALNRR